MALYSITTRAAGLTLTAAIYNADHQNHVDHATAAYIVGSSASVAAMQVQRSPGAVGSESLAASVKEELESLRYVIARALGQTYWYTSPSAFTPTLVAGASVGTGSSITQSLTGTVEKIKVNFYNVSSDSSDLIYIRLGTGGALTTTGYTGSTVNLVSSGYPSVDSANATGGALLSPSGASASMAYTGAIEATRITGNLWSIAGTARQSTTPALLVINSQITLSGACDIVGIALGGNFDGGYWRVEYTRSA